MGNAKDPKGFFKPGSYFLVIFVLSKKKSKEVPTKELKKTLFVVCFFVCMTPVLDGVNLKKCANQLGS